MNGVIAANGQHGANQGGQWGGGGSGGSVYISCRELSGDHGTVNANGGNIWVGGHHGAGAGGRIAVSYDPAEQSAIPDIRFSVEPGYVNQALLQPGRVENVIGLADIGTLWFPDTLFLTETITRLSGRLFIPGFTAWSPASLTISNCWVRFGPDDFELNVGGDLTIMGMNGLHGGRYDLGGSTYGEKTGNILITFKC